MKKVTLLVVFQEMSLAEPWQHSSRGEQRRAEGCGVKNAQGNDFLEFAEEILPCKKGNKTNQTKAARSGRMRRPDPVCQQVSCASRTSDTKTRMEKGF